MEENAGIVRLTAEHNILPFDCGDTIAMYFDLKKL